MMPKKLQVLFKFKTVNFFLTIGDNIEKKPLTKLFKKNFTTTSGGYFNKVIQDFEKFGLVKKNGIDGRSKYLSLTNKGMKVYEYLKEIRRISQ